MLKKTLKLIRALSIIAIWTIVYTYCVRFLVLKVWQFDILAPKSWHIINTFWTSGGAIKTGKDYLFALSLLLIIPLWFIGLKKFLKVGIVYVLLFPVRLINNLFTPKESGFSSVKLKNLGTRNKESLEDIINEKMEKQKKELESKPSNVKDIRNSIKDKLKSMN